MARDKTWRNRIPASNAGAWTSYTPALTNLTLGNGTMVAAFARDGNTYTFRVRIVFGSTTSIGGGVSIGAPANSVAAADQIVTCFIGSSGGATPFAGVGVISASTASVLPYTPSSTTTTTAVRLGTVGMTMGTGAYIYLEGPYEGA